MSIKDIIPNDWKLVRLSEITELITKGTTPTTNGYQYLDDGVNFVKVESIHSNGNFIPKMFAHVGHDCHNSFKRSQLRNNDILFTIAGALGRSAIVNNEILPANTNQAVAIIRLKNNEYLNYIFHYLRGNYVKNLIKKINVSTAQANLSLGQINQFEIPLPPYPEQKKIAELLSTVDDKIEVIDQQIIETQELKKGLMQRLLTKGIGHTKFKDSPLGMIPESWEVQNVENFANVTAGGTPSTKEPSYWGGNIPWMNSGEINLRRIKSVEGRITDIGLKSSSTKIVPTNSVLIALAGQGKTRGKVAINEIPLCTNQSLATIYNFKNVSYEYVFQNLESRYLEIRKMSTGDGGRGGLNLAIIKSIKLALPPIKEQQKIAEILSSVDDKLEVLSEKKTHYQELKQGLMQKLLTGKIRVKV